MARLGNPGQRIVSAAILAPIVVGIVWVGGWWYAAAVAVVWILAIGEWCTLTRIETIAVRAVLIAAAPVCVAAAAWLGLPAAWACLLVAVVATQLLPPAPRPWAAAGLAYIGAAMLSLIYLRGASYWPLGGDAFGRDTVLFVLVIVWTADTFAYVAGRTIGGPRLAPRLSPAKTWAGAIGSVVGAGLVAFLIAVLFMSASVGPGALFGVVGSGLLLAIVAQFGDLLESAVKRRFGVKDAGSLIPGHGGMLDRIDSLMAAAAALALGWWLAAGGGA